MYILPQESGQAGLSEINLSCSTGSLSVLHTIWWGALWFGQLHFQCQLRLRCLQG